MNPDQPVQTQTPLTNPVPPSTERTAPAPQPQTAVPTMPVSPMPTYSTPGTVSPSPVMSGSMQGPGVKGKPPVSVQILYALGFVGLIIGLLVCIVLFMKQPTNYVFESTGATIKDPNYKIISVVYAVFYIFMFFVINAIHSGKKWALITYTALVGINFISAFLNPSTKVLGLSSLVPIVLLAVIWGKDRSYFS